MFLLAILALFCYSDLMIYWLRNVTDVSSEIFMIIHDYFLDAGKYFKDVHDRTDDASINI